MAGTTGRALRADAQRNRDHILDVAEAYLLEHGITGTLDGIAKSAGVGPGTLYRHFPNRESLLAALLDARQGALDRRLDTIRAQSANAGSALQEWLVAVVEWAGAFEGLPEPLRAAMSVQTSPLALTCQGYVKITDMFLAEAQREGSAREDVRGRDLFLAALATSWMGGAALAEPDSTKTIIELIRKGWASTPQR